MYRKIPPIKNLYTLFALLWLFVYEELSGLWPKDLGVYSCLLHATASLHGCFCCFCLDRERNGKSWFEIPRGFAASSTGYESVVWTLAKHKCLFMSGFLGRRELTEFPQHFQGDCVPWQRTGFCSHNQQLLWVTEILFSRGAGVQYKWEVTRETHVKGGLATSTLTLSLVKLAPRLRLGKAKYILKLLKLQVKSISLYFVTNWTYIVLTKVFLSLTCLHVPRDEKSTTIFRSEDFRSKLQKIITCYGVRTGHEKQSLESHGI